MIELMTEGSPKVVLDNFDETLNDGRWHDVIFSISENNMVLNINKRQVITTRLLKIITGVKYMIGGKHLLCFFFPISFNQNCFNQHKLVFFKFHLILLVVLKTRCLAKKPGK